jgi:phosphatidylcholine synthase
LPCSRTERRQAWAVHIFTASGIVVGMLALEAVLSGRPRQAILLLIATVIIDGIDGPMARVWEVKERVPRIDGYVLDLVIDFVTCVIVPAAFLHQFGLLPGRNWSLALLSLIVFTSAIWFSRTDMMTDDHWFRGFPAMWNLVAPTLFLLRANTTLAAFIVVALSVASLTDFEFPHPLRVASRRGITVAMTTVWLGAIVFMTVFDADPSLPLTLTLLVGPAYYIGLTISRVFINQSSMALR